MKKIKPPISLIHPVKREIDFQTQKVVSFSQFQIYLQCPHKWHLQYIKKVAKQEPSINLCFGTAIHNTIQLWLHTMYEESGSASDRLELNEFFQEDFIKEYKKQVESNKGTHFSNPDEMREFYNDGINILNFLKKNRSKYFYSNKKAFLLGTEMFLQKEVRKNIIFSGSIDFALYDIETQKITIYDIKTSTKGWNNFNKKDETKISQVLLYKQFFSELYGFDITNINVEFFIVKRKLEPSEWQEFPKHVQIFSPISGKIKIKETYNKFNEFLNESFDSEGKYNIERIYEKKVSGLCPYCVFFKEGFCDAQNKLYI